MSEELDKLENKYEELIGSLKFLSSNSIPGIDLYMDQVTTFMDQYISKWSRNPEDDKILTKTMINNYAKNDVLIPPVKKKYSFDHMVLLIIIFYMKSFLSISDIAHILEPVKEHHEEPGINRVKPYRYSLKEIYDQIFTDVTESPESELNHLKALCDSIDTHFEEAGEKEQAELQKFELIARLSSEIYIRKLFIERLIDEEIAEEEKNRPPRKGRR